jgi:hypothetical protein
MHELQSEAEQFNVGKELAFDTPHVNGRVGPSSHGQTTPVNTVSAGFESQYNYGLMFRNPTLPGHKPEPDALIELGLAMKESRKLTRNLKIPAGYTYLGQLIAHDVTFFESEINLLRGFLSTEELKSKSSPSLDLNCLYGLGPELESKHPSGRRIYEEDGIRLKVGRTKRDNIINATYPHELPRGHNPQKLEEATIADPRNDENLIIAQTHLALTYFHNAVVDRLSGVFSGDRLFKEAQKKVIQHYQWMILHDYLPRIVQANILKEVLREGSRHFVLRSHEALFMPVEFAFAAFRFGHTLIRDKYEWNRIFQSAHPGIRQATFSDLSSRASAGRGTILAGELILPSSWIIDWTRFYDFSRIPGVTNNPLSNFARKIGASLAGPLMEITAPGPGGRQFRSLAALDLLRGLTVGLPSGQSVAERLEIKSALNEEEIAVGPHREVLKRHKLHCQTPLWYYILKEAKVRNRGCRLGPVGSRIIAEVLVGLIKASEHSILADGASGRNRWRPDLGPIIPTRFQMPDMLFFLTQNNGHENYLNPLGN